MTTPLDDIYDDLSKRFTEIIKFIIPSGEREFIAAMESVFDVNIFRETLDFQRNSQNDLPHLIMSMSNQIKEKTENVFSTQFSFNSKQYVEYFNGISRLVGIELCKPRPVDPDMDAVAAFEIKKSLKYFGFTPGGTSTNPLINDLVSEAVDILDPHNKGISVTKYINSGNKKIEPVNLYYWPFNKEKLPELYKLLLEGQFIKENLTFEESFAIYNANLKNKTIWLKNRTALFALFYFLYNSSYYNTEVIAVVAEKLFTDNKNASLRSWVTGCQEFFKKVENDKNYLIKKHEQILTLISNLQLPAKC